MRNAAAWTLLALVMGAPSVAGAEQPGGLPQDGFYEVEVRLDLPNVEGAGAKKTASVCLSESGDGFAVLSDNNPLARCPASNVRQDGNALTFDIVCQGTNAARGSASFQLAPQGFRGRIAMKMGGKNMTMTET